MIKNWMLLLIVPLLVTGCSFSSKPASAPEACIKALDAAEALVTGPLAEQMDDSVVVAGLVPEAYLAGANNDNAAANSIINSLDEVTARTNARNEEIEELGSQYRSAAEECREGN